jgi:hypothetical protein
LYVTTGPFDVILGTDFFQEEQALMAWTKERLKTFLIPGRAEDIVKIYDPITFFSLQEKSEQGWTTLSPKSDLCLLSKDLHIQE